MILPWLAIKPQSLPGGQVAYDYNGVGQRQACNSGKPVGVADSKKFVFSEWFKVDGGDGTERALLAVGNNTGAADDKFSVVLTTANRVRIIGKNAAGVSILFKLSTPTYLAGSGWHHLLGSVDLGGTGSWMRIDDVLVALTTDDRTDDLIDFDNTGNWNHGGYVATARYNGCLSEVLFHEGIFLADTVANRRKFITAGLKPVGQGPDGSRALGVQPRIYGPSGNLDAADGGENLGSGGGFTTQAGPLAVCANAPGP